MRLPLHVRLALLTALLMLGSLWAVLVSVHAIANSAEEEALQRMQWGLAQHIATHQVEPLLAADGAANANVMHALADHVMALNPAVEVYLLDAQGRVLSHALHLDGDADPVGRGVDLAAIQPLLQPDPAQIRFPVRGPDPRQPGRESVVSVAALGPAAVPTGFVYVVLQGRPSRELSASLANSQARQWAVASAVVVGVVGLLAGAMSLAWITRPLRRLAHRVATIRALAAPTPIARDDEIRTLERAIEALQGRVETQIEQLKEADRQRRDLVSGISHDLRTPLASLRGYVETVLLKADALPAEERARYLRSALHQAERLGRRIAALFELSTLDGGRVQPKPDRFCLAELAQDVVQAYRHEAQERGIALDLAEDCHRTALVQADIALIERVLQNLVDNALRCTPSGGRVWLAVRQAGERVSMTVEDTGRGIAPEHLPHVFERYWCWSADADHPTSGGTGLGLAIVQRIVELHGSRVQVRSAPAQGTRFEFQLAGA